MAFLQSVCVLFLCWVYMATATDNPEPKVLILGGGMAGITAAKTLYDAGFTNFLVLEGSSRIGGRMMETQVGDNTVELGAYFIYGMGSNPIYKLAQESNLSNNVFGDDWTVRNDIGEDITEAADEVYDKFVSDMASFDKHSKQSEACDIPDYSVRASLRNLLWRPKTNIEKAVETYLLDIEQGVSPSALSGKTFRFYVPFDMYGSGTLLVVNDENGFSKIVRHMREGFEPGKETRVMLNKMVTQIKHSKENVKVYLQDGSEYIADYVIITFSVGVLQNRDLIFDPELPQWKTWAIDKYETNSYIQLYLKFDTAFWDNTTEIIFASKRRAYNCVWTNLNIIHPNSNILVLSVLHDEAVRMDALNDSEIINEALVTLRSMYPKANISQPINHSMKRWHSDPLYRGAWSYRPISYTDNDQLFKSLPVGRIHFAGEYIHPKLYGFVNGAYESGLTTASEVLKCINKDANCQTNMNISNTIDVFGGNCSQKSNAGQRLLLTVNLGYISYCVAVFVLWFDRKN